MPKYNRSRTLRDPRGPQSASRLRGDDRRSGSARLRCQAWLGLRRVRRKLLGFGGCMELGELARALKEEPKELGRVLAQGLEMGQVLVVPPGQRHKPSTDFLPVQTEGGPRLALARSGARLCQEKPERCQGRCGNLHLCRYFVFGNCRHSGSRDPCRYTHDIRSEKNRRAVEIHKLESLNADEVCLLLLLNDPVLLPEACSHYNRGDGRFGSCNFGKSCSKLHVCQHFLQGDCRFGSCCKRSHNLLEEENAEKLQKWGIGHGLILRLPEIYKNAFNIKINSPPEPKERSSLSGPVTPSYCLDERSLSPTDMSHTIHERSSLSGLVTPSYYLDEKSLSPTDKSHTIHERSSLPRPVTPGCCMDERSLSPTNKGNTIHDCKTVLANTFLNQSIQIEEEKSWPTIHKLELQTQELDTDGHLQMCTFGPRKAADKDKVIMLLGAMGSGKTTLINGLVNYILGVQWEDDFRFKLIDEESNRSQAESQTSSITSYHLFHQEGFQVPYNLTIIDTPGFGDTTAVDRDSILIEQIRKLFSTPGGVDHIDAVCFVAQSSLARLTPSHRYVFDTILSIFGQDVAENILLLVTFADGQSPLVLDAVRVAEMPCHKENGTPVHFKFNNSALFTCNAAAEGLTENEEDANFKKLFWKMSVNGMRTFFMALNKLDSKRLA